MKKYLSVLVVITLVAPSVTFASWWNPVSWFNNWTFYSSNVDTQILENRISELENRLADHTFPTTTVTESNSLTSATTSKSTYQELLKAKQDKSNAIRAALIASTSVLNKTTVKKSSITIDNTPVPVSTTMCPAGYTCSTKDISSNDQYSSNENIVMCNGRSINDNCALSGKKFYCGPDRMGCYMQSEIDNMRVCNNITYSQCPAGQNFVCPQSSAAYCQDPNDSVANQLQAIKDVYDQRTKDRVAQESQKKNSPECQQATNEYNAIEAQIKPIRDQQNASYNNYLTTGNYNTSKDSYSLTVKLTDLLTRESGLFSKKLAACEIYYSPTVPKIYNTDCQLYGNSASCTMY